MYLKMNIISCWDALLGEGGRDERKNERKKKVGEFV